MSAPAVRVAPRSIAVLAVASLAGLMMLCWPLLLQVPDGARVDPPFLFVLLLPVVIAVVLAELSEGGLDSRVLAILGVLSAINAILRGVSPGQGGVELTFFLLVLAGRVFGPGFGFVLGCTSLFASALLTAGVGPWMPYQMLCAAWVGLFAGLLGVFVRGRIHFHFQDLAAAVRELSAAGFADAQLRNPEDHQALTGPLDAQSARMVRIVEAWTHPAT